LTERLPTATRAVLEVGVLVALCVSFVGIESLRPGAAAVGRPTRDLFDHVALLDQWSVHIDAWGFPDGGSLVPPDVGSMLLAAPFLGAGRGLAFNAAILGALIAACLTGWALGRRVGNGLVGGAALGLSPYLLGQALSGETETLSVWPLAAMALLLEVGGPFAWAGAGAMAGLAALGSWYHGAFAGAVMLIWMLLGPRDRRVLLAPLVFALVAVGPALAYAQVLDAPDQLFRGPAMATYMAEHPRALGSMVADPLAWFGVGAGGANHVDGLGLLAAALGLIGAVAWWREDRRAAVRWVSILLLGLLLSLGPSLHVGGGDTGVPMPGRLLAELPLVGLMRLPHRWMLVASLALAVLAARGARRLPAWAGVFLAVEALWFIVPDRPQVPIAPPPIHAEVRGVVLDLPPRTLGTSDLRGRYLVWQRAHGYPIPYALLMQPLAPSLQTEPLLVAVAALDTRDPLPERIAEASQFRLQVFAREVRRVRARGDAEGAAEGAADRLRGHGISDVVLHQALLDEGDVAAMVELLTEGLGAPSVETEEALLWRL
jgi:hypothetical protein